MRGAATWAGAPHGASGGPCDDRVTSVGGAVPRSTFWWYRPRPMVGQATAAMRAAISPGTRFGRYEVIAEIASGGMATVYLGRVLGAAGFQRLVAIKCLHPHVAKDEEFVGMFMDEARLAARIRHPNVVPTLDLENGEDGLFLVMEFVEGEGLLGLLRAVFKDRKRVPPPIAVRIALDALAGLHAAHELTGQSGEPLRLVHRDVSPHNLLVGTDGIARITDFGIARAEERLCVTRDGQIKGKIAYMAPEQTSGNPVDRRADLWSLGVVLWECLAGRRLFFGQNDGEVLRNLLVNPIPRLKEQVPEIPDALDAVVHKMLSRDPDGRFASAALAAEALEEAGGSVGIASARAVGGFVRDLAGPRVDSLNEAARLVASEASTSAVRPVTRAIQVTDPERTAVRDEPVRKTDLPPAPDVDVSLRTISGPPAAPTAVMQAPPASSRSTQVLLALLALVGVVALIGVGVVLTREKNRQDRGPIVLVSDRIERANTPINSSETVAAVASDGLTDAGSPRVAEGMSAREAAGAPVAPVVPAPSVREAAREPRAARVSRADGVARTPRPSGPEGGSADSTRTGAQQPTTTTVRPSGGTQPFNPEAM